MAGAYPEIHFREDFKKKVNIFFLLHIMYVPNNIQEKILFLVSGGGGVNVLPVDESLNSVGR